MTKEDFKINIDEDCENHIINQIKERTGLILDNLSIDSLKILVLDRLNKYCLEDCMIICKKKDQITKQTCEIKKFIDQL